MEAAEWLAEQDEVEAGFASEFGEPDKMSEAQRQAECDRLLEAIDQLERVRRTKQETARIREGEIRDWLESEEMKINGRVSYLASRVRVLAECLDFAGKKSVRLPHGTVGTQRFRGGVEITDEAAAIAFAKQHGIEIKESIGKRVLAEYIVSTGVIPDGVVVREPEHAERAYIETPTGGRRYMGGE